MHRTAADGNVGNMFSDGDPSTGVVATQVDAAWLNAVQEEIANAIEGAGLTLDPEDNSQLLAAIQTLLGAAAVPHKFEDMWADPDAPASNNVVGASANAKLIPYVMPDASTTGFLAYVRAGNHTKDHQLHLPISMSAAQSGKAVAWRVAMRAIQAGEDPTTNAWDVDSTQVVATPNDVGPQEIVNAAFKLAASFLHADGILIKVLIQRIGANGSDTHTGDAWLLGVPWLTEV